MNTGISVFLSKIFFTGSARLNPAPRKDCMGICKYFSTVREEQFWFVFFCTVGEPVIEAVSVAEVVGSGEEKEPVPLVDYVLNVMKFVDAILSNNSTDDHCREFVNQKGLGENWSMH